MSLIKCIYGNSKQPKNVRYPMHMYELFNLKLICTLMKDAYSYTPIYVFEYIIIAPIHVPTKRWIVFGSTELRLICTTIEVFRVRLNRVQEFSIERATWCVSNTALI